MPGRPNDPRQPRLASGPQLWRLNTLGRLRLVDDAPSISSSDAKLASALRLSDWGFLGSGETFVEQP
jgi:hypothetical protein